MLVFLFFFKYSFTCVFFYQFSNPLEFHFVFSVHSWNMLNQVYLCTNTRHSRKGFIKKKLNCISYFLNKISPITKLYIHDTVLCSQTFVMIKAWIKYICQNYFILFLPAPLTVNMMIKSEQMTHWVTKYDGAYNFGTLKLMICRVTLQAWLSQLG